MASSEPRALIYCVKTGVLPHDPSRAFTSLQYISSSESNDGESRSSSGNFPAAQGPHSDTPLQTPRTRQASTGQVVEPMAANLSLFTIVTPRARGPKVASYIREVEAPVTPMPTNRMGGPMTEKVQLHKLFKNPWLIISANGLKDTERFYDGGSVQDILIKRFRLLMIESGQTRHEHWPIVHIKKTVGDQSHDSLVTVAPVGLVSKQAWVEIKHHLYRIRHPISQATESRAERAMRRAKARGGGGGEDFNDVWTD